MKKTINILMLSFLLLGILPPITTNALVTPLVEKLPNGLGAVYSNLDNAIIAEDFVLTDESSINQIEIWNSLPGPVDITLDIYANTIDTSGYAVPGTNLGSYLFTSSGTPEDSTICSDANYCGYRHTLDLSTPLELVAGNYWLSVYGSSGSNFDWAKSDSYTDLPTFAYKFDTSGTWNGISQMYAFAFRLFGSQATCSSSVVVANANDSGEGSLRQAITDVCAGGTITFDESLSNQTILLDPGSQLTIDKNLTIDASELENRVTVTTDNMGRVLQVNSGTTVELLNLRITHGNISGSGGGIYNQGQLTLVNNDLYNNISSEYGGGIYNTGNLIVNNSILTNNSAQDGGGISNNGGTLYMAWSSLEANSASGKGGGIYNVTAPGIVNVTNTTLNGNTALGRGGGISSEASTTTTITGSSLVGNRSNGGSGGGLSTYGDTTVVNSTFFNNEAAYGGGGIHNSIGTLTLYNSTLSGNTAGENYAGGLDSSDATLNMANTIIANSVNRDDCETYDTVGTSTNNLVEDGTCSTIGTGFLSGDPMLDPLADNGGPTQTMALLDGSPAIDAGDDTICAAAPVNGIDQREVTRPQGMHCDIGAYEFEFPYLWQQLPGGESQQPSYVGSQILCDDFVLTQASTIRQVDFWSSTANPGTIYFGYYENTSDGSGNDIPGALISGYGSDSYVTTVEDTAICSHSYCTYRHSFRDDTTLSAGHYWIRIHGATELYWSSAADLSGNYASVDDFGNATLYPGNLAFRLLEHVSPQINSIEINPSPSIPGMAIWASIYFSDPDSSSHTGVVDWGDGTIENANHCSYGYCSLPDHIFAEAGIYTVQVWVTDGEGYTGTLLRQHEVVYILVPPYLEEWLASDTLPTTILLEGGAVEGHTPLYFKIVTNPDQHGTFGEPSSSVCEFDADWGLHYCTASVVYTPPTVTYNGYDNFSYTADDGKGNFSSAATVPLWVAPNTPPTAQPSSVTVSTILPSSIMLTATDPDFHTDTIDGLSVFIETGPTQGTLGVPEKLGCYLDDSELGNEFGVCNFIVQYTPNLEITDTTDSFTFYVFDTHQYSPPGTVSLELRAPQTLTVNVEDDSYDGDCDTDCSLREAMDAALIGDIIEFDLTYPATIVLEGNDILINKDLIINGPGADLLTISGGAEIDDPEPWQHDRIFTIGNFEEELPVTVAISGLTISDGRADAGGGAAVFNGSSLTMNDCIIGPNNIVTYAGGGVFNNGAHLTMNRCTVTENEGTGSLGGAGVTTAGNGAATMIINSTISGNITNNYGGGLFVGPDCEVTLIHTTVSGNISNANYLDKGEERGGGAGIYIESEPSSDNLIYLQNSIVAGNTDMTDPATAGHEKWPDVYGEFTSLGGNLIGDPTGSTNTWATNDLVGTVETPLDPKLDALLKNDPGKTLTMALLTDSPAIDAVACPEGINEDQRGVERPQGSACDIGAYELEQIPVDGDLKISKTFDPLASGFAGTFAIHYDCDDGAAHDGTVNLAAGGSQTISGIPIGTQCTVTEPTTPTPPTGWSFGTPTFNPVNGTVTISGSVAEVTVTNTISRDLGKLKISKVFDPLTSGFNGTFTIHYDCDDGTAHDGTVNLAAGGSQIISGIPTGTQCTITEPTTPTPPTGWSFGTPTYKPQNGVITVIEQGKVYQVTVTNSISLDASLYQLFLPLIMGD